jgi:hypothetical protein
MMRVAYKDNIRVFVYFGWSDLFDLFEGKSFAVNNETHAAVLCLFKLVDLNCTDDEGSDEVLERHNCCIPIACNEPNQDLV